LPELDGVDQITVGLAFETGGSCDGERAVLRRSELHRTAGERAVDFALEGPRWPPTYRGRLFSGCWYVEAQVGAEKARTELAALAGLGLSDVEMDDCLTYLLDFVQANARAANLVAAMPAVPALRPAPTTVLGPLLRGDRDLVARP
jgi:hypothetical protein